MPNYSQPGSDTARVAFLNSSLGAADSDSCSGNNYILEDTYTKLKDFAPKFEE